METITIRKPDDWHVHLRRGFILPFTTVITAANFRRALVMPNTRPAPVLTGKDALQYKHEILSQIPDGPVFEPLMTIQITDNTTPEMIREAYAAGVVAGKVYPIGVTTNSDNGLRGFPESVPSEVFTAMEEVGMVLCLHGESSDSAISVMERESVFLNYVRVLSRLFRRLKIVVEHITTRKGVEVVSDLFEYVAATLTVHHMVLTINDVIGGELHPHYFCKPIPKTADDRRALRRIVLSGNPKFFLGTDSAPHPSNAKECASGAAGIFTALVALPILAEFFEESGALDKLENFTSVFGAQFYNLPLNEEKITLGKEPWIVPQKCMVDVVPFMAGKVLQWQVTK